MGSNPFSVVDGQLLAALQDFGDLTAVVPASAIFTTDRGIDARMMLESEDLQPAIWITPSGDQPFEADTGSSEKVRLDFEILIVVPGSDSSAMRQIQFLVLRALKNLENCTDAAGALLERPFPYILHSWALRSFNNPLPAAPTPKAITLAEVSAWYVGDDSETRADFELITPTDLLATLQVNNGSQAEVEWTDNSTAEDGHEIHRQKDGGGFSLLTTTAADATSYLDETLEPSSTYEYKARAKRGVEFSDFSNTDDVVTGAKPSALGAEISASTRLVTISVDITLEPHTDLDASLFESCHLPTQLLGDVAAPAALRAALGLKIRMPHVEGGVHACGFNRVRQTAADPLLMADVLGYPMDAIDLTHLDVTIVA